MNSFTVFTCAALLFAAPCIALAQNETAANSLPDPADMRVMVPAPDYHSPLNDYLGITEAVDSPAKNWRSANDHIGKEGGMGGMDMSGDTGQHQHGGKP